MATTTASCTLNTWNDAGAPNNDFDESSVVIVAWDPAHALLKFAMPADPGSATITAVKFFFYVDPPNGTGINTEGYRIHQLTQTGWTESGTWNKYDGTNNWTTAGGDYSATVINTIPTNPTGGNAAYGSIDIGAGATNPLTINWGDTVHLLVKTVTDTISGTLAMQSRASAHPPYLEVTYIVPSFSPSVSPSSSLSP